MLLRNALGSLVAMGLACQAIAQDQPAYHVACSRIEAGTWVFTPAYADDGGDAPQVHSFLALAQEGGITGDNLVAVWYIRGESGWSYKSWSTPDPWEAIKWVKSEMSIPDDEDYRWGIPGTDLGIAQPEEPKDYVAGVLETDPLAPALVESPDRDAIVAILAASGYPAADVRVDAEDGCTTDEKLTGMALAIEQTLQGDEKDMVERSMDAWVASGAAECGFAEMAAEVVEFPPRAITPWSPPSYDCETTYYDIDGWTRWQTCLTWYETRTVTQKRTRARLNPAPPPTYQFCDQTRSGTETRKTQCCAGGMLLTTPPVFCPTVAPGTTPPIGTGCPAGSTTTTSTSTSWSDWAPPCPF
jgi:hypothetical protein